LKFTVEFLIENLLVNIAVLSIQSSDGVEIDALHFVSKYTRLKSY